MTKIEEFRRGWVVLAAATFGVGVGVSSLLTYSTGLFYTQLSRSIGLTRTEFGMAYFGATMVLAVAMPLVGKMVDRFGATMPVVFGAGGLALAYALLGVATNSVVSFAALMLLLGLLGAPSTSVGFTRAVTQKFDKARGLALGITQAGIGISAVIVPVTIALVIHHYGWRAGFFTLSAIAMLGIPVALLGLPRGQRRADIEVVTERDAFRRVVRSPAFWLQASAFTLVTLTFVGMVVHLVPMLEQQGLTAQQAARYAGLVGISVLVSRIVVGWLADVVHSPWLGAASCLLGSIGSLALVTGNPAFAPVAAIGIGCAVGAEIDLLGYLTSRNFSMATYGRTYAWQYAGVICASGASPAWVGWLSDQTGYTTAASFSAGLGLVAALMFMLLKEGAGTSHAQCAAVSGGEPAERLP